MTIKIQGVIGWDVIGSNIANLISRLDGDINIEIDSPGGSMSDGFSIANALEDYSRGKINIKVVGQCSSMAAYIMLFGDSLTFKPNATVVLHNPWNCCCGDYKAMKKAADVLERFAALYANKFVEKGIFTEKEIRSIMDEETYFIGEKDLIKLGNIDKTDSKAESELDRETQIALAQENIKTCQAKLRQAEIYDYDKVAALISQPKTIQAGIGGNKSPHGLSDKDGSNVRSSETQIVSTVQKKGEEKMDLNELKTQNPDVFAQAVNIGSQQEQARINALMQFIDVDKETVCEAIANGKSIKDDEIQAKFLKAKINASTVAQMEKENPTDVNPNEPPHAPETPEEQAAQAKKEQEEKAKKEFEEACSYLK